MNKKEAMSVYKDELKSICGDYEELVSFLSFCTNFNKKSYSSMNKAIIRHFYPQSLFVNTMKQWNLAGYSVKKGEEAMCLLAPNFKKRKKVDKDGVETDETEDYLCGFSCFWVFDASQVKDKEGNPFIPEAYEFDPLFEVDEDLNDAIESLGGEVEYTEGYENLNTLFNDNLSGAIAEYVLASQLCIPTDKAVINIKRHMDAKEYDVVKAALREGQDLAKKMYERLEEKAFA